MTEKPMRAARHVEEVWLIAHECSPRSNTSDDVPVRVGSKGTILNRKNGKDALDKCRCGFRVNEAYVELARSEGEGSREKGRCLGEMQAQ